MTIWDKIYKEYKNGGQAWATLEEGIIPEFLDYVKNNEFKLKNALDIGCGTGNYLVYLKSLNFKTAGIDSSKTSVEITKQALANDNSKVQCVDMFDYKIEPDKYDFIFSVSTIHHGTKGEVINLISQIHCALISEGKIFITLPDYESSKHWHTFKNHDEIEPETFSPLSGPEKGLPHSFYKRDEVEKIFSKFRNIKIQLGSRGKWIITGEK